MGNFTDAFIFAVKIVARGNRTGKQGDIFFFPLPVCNANGSPLAVGLAVISWHNAVKFLNKTAGIRLFHFNRKNHHKIIASNMTNKTIAFTKSICGLQKKFRCLAQNIIPFFKTIPVIETLKMIEIDIENGEF